MAPAVWTMHSANTHKPWTHLQERIFPLASCGDTSTPATEDNSLFFTESREVIQVCCVSPCSKQGRDNAAEPEPSPMEPDSSHALHRSCALQCIPPLAGEAALSLGSQLPFAFCWALPGPALDPLLGEVRSQLCVPCCGAAAAPEAEQSLSLSPACPCCGWQPAPSHLPFPAYYAT